MYKVPLTLNLEAGDALQKLHFSKVRSTLKVKMRSDAGASMTFGAD